jgi:hypothetical protein
MYAFDDFDGADLAEPVDLDDQLGAQFGPHRRIESQVLFTEIVGGEVALTVVRVTVDGRYRHQCYAVTEGTWVLTGIFGLYTDALSELLRWRRYIASGGTVAAWQLEHPWVTPETRGF